MIGEIIDVGNQDDRVNVRGRSSNGRALDSKSNGCGFKSRRPHFFILFFSILLNNTEKFFNKFLKYLK